MSSPSKRRDLDIMKLMMSEFEVSMGDDCSPSDFYVKFYGPKDSPYDGGIYKIHVTLPATYPYKSPSIGFCTPIFHPNVDEASGSVCLDVINQTWSPMFDLVNIFSVFLPQLLLYPNPADPLNGHAAAIMNRDKEEFNRKVREHVQRHAMKEFKLSADDDEDEASSSAVSISAAASTNNGATNGNGHSSSSAGSVSASVSVPRGSNAISHSDSRAANVSASASAAQSMDEFDDDLSDVDDLPAGDLEL